ncbi:MAG: PD-(D/E)XK nuclease domain-containing protein, partial [Elusimicrobiota bacterium]|nr:PD-(D/E)XK nuclease domain-containing protein [Elusimicrobiota bacterium]
KIKRRADTAANERFYHSHLAILLAANGFMLEGESSSGLGNADIVILNENFTLVCEIKYTADISKAKTKVEEALMQIKEKQYYAKYTLGKNNRVILLGLVFAAGGKKVKCKLEEILF